MNKVFQSLGKGNCLQACVASVLERPLDSVPDFDVPGWFKFLCDWCGDQGIGVVYMNESHPISMKNITPILIYEIAESTDRHAVVGKIVWDSETLWRTEVVHDPNPMNLTLLELEGLMILVPS